MEYLFKKFEENITLKPSQKEDARTKYNDVCKTVHNRYYDAKYDGSTKLLFGSYKVKTNIRPLSKGQDVDVLIMLPGEVFDRFDAHTNNGQAALLNEIRGILKERFTTTEKIKAWGKVILVEFSDGHHNVELLPAFEQEDGRFLIPNAEDGGSWNAFDPRTEVEKFNTTNNSTDNALRRVVKFTKRWRNNTPSLSLASHTIQQSGILFFDAPVDTSSSFEMIRDFLIQLKTEASVDQVSHYETALTRLERASEYWDSGDKRSSTLELRKIFGEEFPVEAREESKSQVSPEITVRPKPWLKPDDSLSE
ncbi:MAG: nucleotidyltransferase [Alkalispirochaeta sp.]